MMRLQQKGLINRQTIFNKNIRSNIIHKFTIPISRTNYLNKTSLIINQKGKHLKPLNIIYFNKL